MRARHRLDIEGLRGLAVLLVVLFHADVPGFDGGYVGVDVFFVISGFLITGLLVAELERTGRVSLATFYARRVRRLLPSSGLVIVVVLLGAALTLAPLLATAVLHDGLSAALFGANFRFAGQASDYFAARSGPSPFLHFWSLSLEEQFYAVWPSLLLVVGGGARFGRRRIIVLLVAVFTLSLGASVWLTAHDRPWAFFMLPTRAWEFAVGGLLALWGAGAIGGPQLVTWVGLALVGAATVLFDSGSAFPGWIALAPVIGTALVIANGGGTLLSQGPLPWLGRRSYVLYLWHWPMLVLIPAAFGSSLGLVERLVVCAAAVVLADMTHRVMERPVHESGWMVAVPRRALAVGAGIIAATVVGSILTLEALPSVAGSGRAPARARPQSVAEVQQALTAALDATQLPGNLEPPLSELEAALPRFVLDGCHVRFGPTEPPREGCVYGDEQSALDVVLLGDSHAGQWFPALDALGREHGFRVRAFTKSSCPSVDISVLRFGGIEYPECDEFRVRALARIRRLRPELVIFSTSIAYLEAADRDAWQAAYTRTLRQLRAAAASVVAIGDTPQPADDIPTCLSQHPSDVRACVKDRALVVNDEMRAVVKAAARSSDAGYVDPTDWACAPGGCPPVVGRFLVWRDNNHLTPQYVRWLTDVIREAIPLPTRGG